jgi:hypothetical protein
MYTTSVHQPGSLARLHLVLTMPSLGSCCDAATALVIFEDIFAIGRQVSFRFAMVALHSTVPALIQISHYTSLYLCCRVPNAHFARRFNGLQGLEVWHRFPPVTKLVRSCNCLAAGLWGIISIQCRAKDIAEQLYCLGV